MFAVAGRWIVCAAEPPQPDAAALIGSRMELLLG
jgi:hypothetical protein